MQVIDVVCTHCDATVGNGCRTASGRSCAIHKDRFALWDKTILEECAKKVESVVPAIAQPVMALKEKFTLAGEPLAISTCMKALGLELDKQDGNHFCFWPVHKDTQYVLIYSGDHWEESAYLADAETYETTRVSEAEVLMKLIRRYYMLNITRQMKADKSVLSSLSARLLPLATKDQLDMLRSEIKTIACPVK